MAIKIQLSQETKGSVVGVGIELENDRGVLVPIEQWNASWKKTVHREPNKPYALDASIIGAPGASLTLTASWKDGKETRTEPLIASLKIPATSDDEIVHGEFTAFFTVGE